MWLSTWLQKQAQLPNNLLDFFASVIDTYDIGNNKAVDLIYLDFQKVPHLISYHMKGSL